MLANSFTRVRCESCKDEMLVAFSCKGRGVCPSCNAKRAQVTAAHLVEQVLRHVPCQQWTLSFPHRVRLRPFLLPLAEADPKEQEASASPETAAKAEPKERTPLLDWTGLLRRTFGMPVRSSLGWTFTSVG